MGLVRRLLGLVVFALFIAGPARANEPPPPLSAYGELPGVEMMAMSPSGSRLAVIAMIKGARQLMILEQGNVILICPLLSGPKSVLDLATKEEWNGEEAQAGGDYRQAA